MITKEIFNATEFKSHGIIYFNDKKHVYRVPAGWTPTQLPDDLKGRHSKLRMNVSMIMEEENRCYEEKEQKKIGLFPLVEKQCNIPEDTMKKMQSGKRRFTREQLAKFCIGFKLPIEKADELFLLQGGRLNLTNDFDFIVYHALKTKDDIEVFCDEVLNYLHHDLRSTFK